MWLGPCFFLHASSHARSLSWRSLRIRRWYLVTEPSLLSDQWDKPTSAEALEVRASVSHG